MKRILARALLLTLATLPSLLAQSWEPLPMVTGDNVKAGIAGGEGTQWPIGLACDPKAGNLLFLGTDVGGVYRSSDGGKSWIHSNLGLQARGACAFAFDPGNTNNVLLVASNSMARAYHGLYLSTDAGLTWKSVQPFPNLGYRDHREQIAFDPATFDAHKKRTLVAYWSTEPSSDGQFLFKTTDGGDTWQKLPGVEAAHAILKVHPTKGYVYAGNEHGFWRSEDGGQTFTQTVRNAVTGLDVVAAQPDNVYILTKDGLLVSKDAGQSFDTVVAHQPPKKLDWSSRLKVSPADPNRMLLDSYEGQYNFKRYVTLDGGDTWQPVEMDRGPSFIPMNNRESVFAWHPTDPNTAWSFGGDFVMVSHDGGKSFAWSNSGYNGIMVGGAFHFSAQDPKIMYFGSQDYDGAITKDGGATWTYIGLDGLSWGGEVYGGYAVNGDLIYGGVQNLDGRIPRHLKITRDGGATVTDTGLELHGLPTSMNDPAQPDTLFCYEWRSDDAGVNWSKMADCAGVLTAADGRLFGGRGKTVVASSDHGVTWQSLTDVPNDNVNDVAYDPKQKRLYIAAGGRLFTFDDGAAAVQDITDQLPADEFGERGAFSVAVDPVDPNVVYTAKSGNTHLMDTAVCRSVDGGKTWQNLILNLRDKAGTGDKPAAGRQGALEANWVRVNPATRYAYFGTNCFGFWRIGPPK